MGNSQATLNVLALVDKAKFNELFADADSKLENPSSLTPSPANLEVILTQLADEKFKGFYHYAYEGNKSRPLHLADDATTGIESISGLCNITDANLDQISPYVDSILTDIEIDWVKSDVHDGLVSQGQGINLQIGDSWNISRYSPKYDSPHDQDQNSFQFDGVVIFSNIRITTKRPITHKYSIIHYAGVLYEVLSPLKQAKSDLLSLLIANAKLLIDEGVPDDISSQIVYLEAILSVAAYNLFKEQFGFPYEGDLTQPPDLASGGSVSGVATLLTTEDVSQPNPLSALIDEHIINVVNIPDWAKAAARTALQNAVSGVFHGPPLNVWQSITFEDIYQPQSVQTTPNACKTIARFIYCKASYTEGSITVERWSVYYIGVYYDTPLNTVVIRNTFLSKLCESARKLINQSDPCPPYPTVSLLGQIVEIHGKKHFSDTFSFPHLGNQTNPPDKLAGAPVYATSTILQVWDNLPASLEREISNKILLPGWVHEEAKRRLYNLLLGLFQVNTYFGWENRRVAQLYSNAHGNEYKLMAILTFSNSTLSDSTTITATLIHYVGIFYRVDPLVPTVRFSENWIE